MEKLPKGRLVVDWDIICVYVRRSPSVVEFHELRLSGRLVMVFVDPVDPSRESAGTDASLV